jgi:hypothetical protein
MGFPRLSPSVMLNLFQYPSCRTDRSVVDGAAMRLGWLQHEGSVWAEEWTLKQVQGDEVRR